MDSSCWSSAGRSCPGGGSCRCCASRIAALGDAGGALSGNVGSGWSTAAMAEQGATIAEGDEPGEPASDNCSGRLLALDVRLPDLGADPSDAQLRHAIGHDWRVYLAFFISFYVVVNYWGVH